MSTSNARRERRLKATSTAKILDKLSTLLEEFNTFLSKTPQPSDEEVRAMFLFQDTRWRRYCYVHKLTDKAALMFNNEVAVKWRGKMKGGQAEI